MWPLLEAQISGGGGVAEEEAADSLSLSKLGQLCDQPLVLYRLLGLLSFPLPVVRLLFHFTLMRVFLLFNDKLEHVSTAPAHICSVES